MINIRREDAMHKQLAIKMSADALLCHQVIFTIDVHIPYHSIVGYFHV